MAISPLKGDLTAGVAGQWSETLNAPEASLVTGDAPAESWMLLPAAAGQTFAALQVVGFDGAGKVVPAELASVAGVKATGTITFSGTGTAADTVTVGGRVYTLVASLTGAADEVLVGASATATAQAFKNAINADEATLGVTHGSETDHPSVVASGAAAAITLTAKAAGAAGNSVTTVESGTGASFGAATLTGGVTSAVTGVQAVGFIKYAPSAATTDGQLVSVTRQGVFNPDRLVFDASYDTAEKKRLAFEGAPSPTSIILRAPAAMTA